MSTTVNTMPGTGACAARSRRALRIAIVLLATTLLLASTSARAATVYVYSFLGHQLTIVNAVGIESAPLDRKQRTVVPIRSDDFDHNVASDAGQIVGALSPPYGFARLTAAADASPDIDYDALAKLSINGWFERLSPIVRFADGDRLVLIVPASGEIRFAVYNGDAGAGREAGLGIYVEPDADLTGPVASKGHGMLGLFVNFRVLVIDALSRRFIAEKVMNRGIARSGRDAPGGVPWAAVADHEKFVLLREVVRAGLRQALPELLGAR